MEPVIKSSSGISIGLVITIVLCFKVIAGIVVTIVFLKCKAAWAEADRQVELRTDGKVSKVDDKLSERTISIYNRIDNEKNQSDKKLNEEGKDLQKRHEDITILISAGFEKVHDKMDIMTGKIHKIDKRVAVIEGNSGKKRISDENENEE